MEDCNNLDLIVDLNLRPCNGDRAADSSSRAEGGRHLQSLAVTCSGIGKDGTVRLIRNGVGKCKCAAVEMGGIKGMWSFRGIGPTRPTTCSWSRAS